MNNLFLTKNIVLRNKYIFVGDFNEDYLTINEFLSYRHLFDIMSVRGFRQLIDKPTRISSTTGLPKSLLHHIWVNFERDVLTEVVNYPLSDHLPIVLILKLQARKNFVKKSFRELGEENFKRYDRDKSRLFNSYTIDSNDVNDEVNKFLKWLENMIDNYFPIKF